MVSAPQFVAAAAQQLIVAQQAVQPALERMKPEQRVAIIMALLGLTLIGLFLIVFAMVGGHWVRRLARHRPRQAAARRRAVEAADLQLRQSLQSFLPEAKTDDTVQFGKSSPDTKVGG